MDNKSTKLKIRHWNANGLTQKIPELYEFIRQESIDIMLINETKFNKNSKLTKFLGYNFIRQDRPDSINGGGLLIIVNNTIKFSELPTKQLNTIEALGIKLANNIEIYSVYVRPKNTGKTNKIDPNELKQLMINSRTILLGDFNAKHTDWHCSIKNTNGNILTNLTDNNHFEILAPDRYTLYPTNGGKPSTVDLALLKNIYHADIETINDLDSDHLPLILTLNQTNTIKLDTKTVLNYKKANWQQFREIINDSIIINSNINSKEKIDKCIKNLTNTINDAISIAIPEIEITAKIKPLPDHIILLIKNRNKLRRQYQRTGNKLIKIQKETLAQNIKQLITEHRNDQWDKKLQNLKNEDNLTININNTIIEPKTNAKYLGVILDNKLTYVSHINKACSNAKSIKHILYPLIGHRSKLSIKNKLILYKSMIKPILLYAAPIWSSASNININKIKTIENKILRMISNARLYERNDSIKSRLNIDEIYNDIHKRTQDFYNNRTKNLEILQDVGIFNKDTAPFKIKHKLPNHILIN
ncbi:Similar to X-element\ORF2: Probable RNA-directed DNA polymerase from transposon X-element (Drosophila melanogaster) [Cotesia congregata]|uniref:Similar to X-element\ORF2: Probable RNA-directed DNA polymerase from transposon X-element (Drosophila melanogaster) n=1 Tax=Cotesia congregata TaxID=51543 RepID=A0A8J2HD33_COTCN|nr:Similar to X-element\ORF2: Probable RNA-directed DNA polymerase from transposon X-element (Drosophila melanogaster) [Cotesia congregata]